MVSYATVGSNNLPKAVAFYDELLGVIGMSKLFDHQSGGRLYGGDKQGMFGVLGPYDGNPATVGNGTMVGFAMKDLDQMAAFHAKAIALGGTDEGAPGPRGPEEAEAFAAYVRDLDGNKICAFKFGKD